LRQANKEAIAKQTGKGKWGVTKTPAEQEAERIASQRRQFTPELRNQMANLTHVCFFIPFTSSRCSSSHYSVIMFLLYAPSLRSAITLRHSLLYSFISLRSFIPSFRAVPSPVIPLRHSTPSPLRHSTPLFHPAIPLFHLLSHRNTTTFSVHSETPCQQYDSRGMSTSSSLRSVWISTSFINPIEVALFLVNPLEKDHNSRSISYFKNNAIV
jgi:hypothetical protein